MRENAYGNDIVFRAGWVYPSTRVATQASPKSSAWIVDTRVGINPSRTLNNAIFIYSNIRVRKLVNSFINELVGLKDVAYLVVSFGARVSNDRVGCQYIQCAHVCLWMRFVCSVSI